MSSFLSQGLAEIMKIKHIVGNVFKLRVYVTSFLTTNNIVEKG